MRLLLIFSILISIAEARPIHEFLDLQTHLTMGHTYFFFPKELKEGGQSEIEALTCKHMFKNVLYTNLLRDNKGSRIIINGAIPFEFSQNKIMVTKAILEQIEAVDEFARQNANDFVVARSPDEVRKYIHETKKTVILHSIEGANGVIGSQEDADFWASKGVVFITLIHLLDGEYGGSGHNPGLMGKLINYRGTINKIFHPNRRRGLTEKGRNAIRWMARAGIMTDLTHMSSDAVDDSLEVFRELHLPPLATHSHFKPVQNNDRAITQNQLLEIYRLGGLFSLPISGESLRPKNPTPEFLRFINGMEICEGSLDSYRVSFQFAQKTLLNAFLQKDTRDLSEEERIEFSLGWQSDFNGWLNHSRPRFGKEGCRQGTPMPSFEQIETKGLAHPGLLPQYWDLLKADGMDVSSLRYSSEKFLRMWEKFRSRPN